MERKRLTISFDLDGTLTDPSFVDAIWNEGVPRELSRKRHISFDKARYVCRTAYEREGEESIRWYQIGYWLNFFGLDTVSIERLVREFTSKIALFDDVLPVLESFMRQDFAMFVFSNATRAFLDQEIKETGVSDYFNHIISVPDDWGMIKSDKASFIRLRSMVRGRLIHIGDHVFGDYEVPRSVGIEAYHLCRGPGPNLNSSIKGLDSLVDKVLCGE